MTVKVKYYPKKSGFRAIFNSPEVCDLCTAHAERICATANGMYGSSGYKVSAGRAGKFRAHALVYTATNYAMHSNTMHNTLQKSLG